MILSTLPTAIVRPVNHKHNKYASKKWIAAAIITFVSQGESTHLREIFEGFHANDAGSFEPHDSNLVLLDEAWPNRRLLVRFLVDQANQRLYRYLFGNSVDVANGRISSANNAPVLQNHHLCEKSTRVTTMSISDITKVEIEPGRQKCDRSCKGWWDHKAQSQTKCPLLLLPSIWSWRSLLGPPKWLHPRPTTADLQQPASIRWKIDISFSLVHPYGVDGSWILALLGKTSSVWPFLASPASTLPRTTVPMSLYLSTIGIIKGRSTKRTSGGKSSRNGMNEGPLKHHKKC